jgi:hypothetical protein
VTTVNANDEATMAGLQAQPPIIPQLQPAARFLTNTPVAQFRHICSEFAEVSQALYEFEYQNGGLNHLAEELVDLQMSGETMLAILGFDNEGRNNIRRQVIEKNGKRGYYEEPNTTPERGRDNA